MTPPATGATGAADLPEYAPIPRPALGEALNDQGYYVGQVERNLYWVTDGVYQSAFLTTSDGVVLFDAPPSIGGNLRRAVDEVAAANGVSNRVTHLVYSHHHADHGAAASLFGGDVVRVGHEETRRLLLLRDADPARPVPEVTFTDTYTLEVGGERAELAWHGPNHSPDNIYIHFPDHDTLMFVRPGRASQGRGGRHPVAQARRRGGPRRPAVPGQRHLRLRRGHGPISRSQRELRDLDRQELDMSETLDWNAKTIAEFRANEGRVGGNFEGAPIVLVHHRGRKSGRECKRGATQDLPSTRARPPESASFPCSNSRGRSSLVTGGTEDGCGVRRVGRKVRSGPGAASRPGPGRPGTGVDHGGS